jgi:ribosomal protein S27E
MKYVNVQMPTYRDISTVKATFKKTLRGVFAPISCVGTRNVSLFFSSLQLYVIPAILK